jgi:coenzyme F420-dependent glucose-6-phosphate dehydrogenase
MAIIGYHASHELLPPSALLDFVQRAERAGFAAGMCSDHFHPWSEKQGESGFAWSWLGAALASTQLSFGTVNAPGQRYHPAIVAQASATLAEMFPGRFWLAVGTGEALNELITGDRWPSKAERQARLRESVDVIRALWRGETVSHRGLITVEEAKLYTRPQEPPLLVGAALTPETARWIGGWADGMVTIAQETHSMQELIDAFRAGGGAAKPMFLQALQVWAPTDDEALSAAHERWSASLVGSAVLGELRSPQLFDAASNFVKRDDVRDQMRISADLDRHVEWLRGDVELGFERIYIHNPWLAQARFIDAFGERVLPAIGDG